MRREHEQKTDKLLRAGPEKNWTNGKTNKQRYRGYFIESISYNNTKFYYIM